MTRPYDEVFFCRFEDGARRVMGEADFRGSSKAWHDVRARGVCWRMLHEVGGLTLQEIGRAYGRHHSNILRSIRKAHSPNRIEERERERIKAWLEGEGR
jgi:chromosomal replication initiation ATPase DnaA